MKFHISLIAGFISFALAVPGVEAAIITIIDDNFDSYANQAAFDAVWPPSGASGTLTSAQFVSSPNSIQNSAGATQRNDRTFSGSTATDIVATDTNRLEWSYMFYDDPANFPPAGNTLGRTYGQLLGRRPSDGALNQLLAMGLWNANIPKASDGVTSTTAELRQYYAARVAFSPGPNWFLLDTGPLRSPGWHEFKAIIGSTQVEFLIDGVSAAVRSYAASEGAVGWYQARIGSGLSTSAGSAFDDYLLRIVPEPATFGLAGLGLFSLALVTRRKGR